MYATLADILEQVAEAELISLTDDSDAGAVDETAVDRAVAGSQLIVTVEEHTVVGGLGGAVAEYKSSLRNAPPQLTIGLPDAFGKTGEYRYLLEHHGLVGEAIARRIGAALSS